MSYGADFPSADPANAPLDAPIYFGADPVLWIALIFGLLAAALLGWFLRERTLPRTGDASTSIWKAIDEAAKDAMKADDNALQGRAEQLLSVVERRIGKTLALAGSGTGLAARVAALKAAAEGKPPASHDDHADGHKGAHDDHGKDHGHPSDPHDHKDDHHAHGPASGVSAAAASITINVASTTVARPEKPDHDGQQHHPPHPLTRREQLDQLRLAVAAFNEHWRRKDDRIAALRAALRELSGDDSRDGGPVPRHD